MTRARAPRRLFIGLMSGTSLDGIDAALVDFTAAPNTPASRSLTPQTLATHYVPFETSLRAKLLALQAADINEIERGALAANQLTRAYAAAVRVLLAAAHVDASEVEAIGAHGQTVRHRPEQGFTIQLNNPALLSELTNITVVADFRSRDIAAGGQGAPLVPAFHQAVFGVSSEVPDGSGAGAREPENGAAGADRVIVNIGGIANLTHLPLGGPVTGFDTGPGNTLMDLWTQRHRNQAYDAGGTWAASGRMLPALLERLLAEPYFHQAPPKSTGRDLFHAAWLEQRLTGSEAAADVQATLCELTARSIATAVNGLAGTSKAEAYVCGGGAHNVHLIGRLRAAAPRFTWQSTALLGVPPDWVEAVAFAWLAYQLIERKPASLSQVTGAAGTRLLGAIYPK